MKTILFLLGMAWAVHSPAAEAAASRSRVAPAPLFRDPVHDGAADATLIWNRAEKCWWMLYTNRRADADDEIGVKWVHGTDIGIASTPDGGLTWTYRGIARGLEFETNATRNTFWALEVVDFGGRYHAFVSYVRGVPETWKRDAAQTRPQRTDVSRGGAELRRAGGRTRWPVGLLDEPAAPVTHHCLPPLPSSSFCPHHSAIPTPAKPPPRTESQPAPSRRRE